MGRHELLLALALALAMQIAGASFFSTLLEIVESQAIVFLAQAGTPKPEGPLAAPLWEAPLLERAANVVTTESPRKDEAKLLYEVSSRIFKRLPLCSRSYEPRWGR